MGANESYYYFLSSDYCKLYAVYDVKSVYTDNTTLSFLQVTIVTCGYLLFNFTLVHFLNCNSCD